jgi:hypothetical protein
MANVLPCTIPTQMTCSYKSTASSETHILIRTLSIIDSLTLGTLSLTFSTENRGHYYFIVLSQRLVAGSHGNA